MQAPVGDVGDIKTVREADFLWWYLLGFGAPHSLLFLPVVATTSRPSAAPSRERRRPVNADGQPTSRGGGCCWGAGVDGRGPVFSSHHH